jgi:four helix bundle protein
MSGRSVGERPQRFEDLVTWQKSRALAQRVYELTRGPAMARDWGLVDQMRRSSVSVMSNIAEGFERGSAADFHRFLFIAKGSAAELRSQLYGALDAGYCAPEAFRSLLNDSEEVSRLLGGLRAAVARQKDTR